MSLISAFQIVETRVKSGNFGHQDNKHYHGNMRHFELGAFSTGWYLHPTGK